MQLRKAQAGQRQCFPRAWCQKLSLYGPKTKTVALGKKNIGLRAVALAKKICNVEQINDMAGKNINNALMVQFFPMNELSKNLDIGYIGAFTAACGDFTSSIRHEKTSIAY